MEKFTDFFKDIKERASNPLLYSFLLSWIIFNWKIIIGLFFYGMNDLKADGYNSYIDLISKNLNPTNTLVKPFFTALAYTFVFPFIRNVIYAFGHWIKSWGNAWGLRVSKSNMFSINKYIELRESYKKKTDLLQEVLDKDSEFVRENERLKNINEELSSRNNIINDELIKLRNQTSASIISGSWEVISWPRNEKTVERIFIDGNRIIDSDNQNLKIEIKNFVNYYESENIAFLTIITGADNLGNEIKRYNFYSLSVRDNFKLLIGHQNDNVRIEFKKR